MYYPLGVNDPDYCVLKFTGQSGRFYADLKSTNFIIEQEADASKKSVLPGL